MNFVLSLHEKKLFDHKIKISNKELISDLKRVAKLLNKKTVTTREYHKHGKYAPITVYRRFNSWVKALENAGLEKSSYDLNIDNKSLLENIAEVWRKLGRQPTYRDMKKPFSKYGAQTYLAHFGSWNNALIEFIKTVKPEKK
ncbi:MAG: hypothetical protein LBD44_04785 [Spirochaetaceae bacterium]|jgi:hypothetical protein|nr:hypothetical protein [Spirochaetaceae bacterium]